MTTRQKELIALQARQNNVRIVFTPKKGSPMALLVPKEDVRDRGKFFKGDSCHQVLSSINNTIEKFLSMSEEDKGKEENVCNFAQDVVLLWHAKDPRVELKDD